MGCGKSSVGKQLAANLGYEFKDLDTQIEEEEAKTISEIFLEKGEIYFRKKRKQYFKAFNQHFRKLSYRNRRRHTLL